MASLNKANIVALSSTLLGLLYAAYRLGRKSYSQETDNKSKKKTGDSLSHDDDDEEDLSSKQIVLHPIGSLSSVYRLCVGTPRQGLLAPNSRGRITLDPSRISHESVIDLEKFSHIWIVFVFHLNSNTHVVNRSTEETTHQFPAKIAPPALGGKRVGIFSTRSPHRPNPVGFTLCKIDSVNIPKKKNRFKRSEAEPCSINVSGLDLVDGTPIIDLKPYVPHYDSVAYLRDDDEEDGSKECEVKLPTWVREGLNKRREVRFSTTAEQELGAIMKRSKIYGIKFYGVSSGRDISEESAFTSIKACITEVLGVDVRSAWQTGKARNGKSHAERSARVKLSRNSSLNESGERGKNENDEIAMCTQQLDNLLIKYTIDNKGNAGVVINTNGSGADDLVTVRGVEPISQKYQLPDEKKINFSSALSFWSNATSPIRGQDGSIAMA